MKRYCEFNFLQKIALEFIWLIEKKLYGRKWTYRDQVYHAMININEDSQWMSHNKIAKEVSIRHAKMLNDKWYETAHESQEVFRSSIGLNPHKR